MKCQVNHRKYPQFLQSKLGMGAQAEKWMFLPPEGRVLTKLPPPKSAVRGEPEAKCARDGDGAGGSASHQLTVERRVEKVCVEETMYHLDEVVDVETLTIEDGEDEVDSTRQSMRNCGVMSHYPEQRQSRSPRWRCWRTMWRNSGS